LLQLIGDMARDFTARAGYLVVCLSARRLAEERNCDARHEQRLEGKMNAGSHVFPIRMTADGRGASIVDIIVVNGVGRVPTRPAQT
jgi:hypothetical protein